MNERQFGERENNKNDFARFLEQKGFQVVESVETGGDQRVSIAVPEGRFHLVAEFPKFDPADRKFFYGNNVVEMQHKPLELDFNSPLFQRLAKDFQNKIHPNEGVDEIVAQLDEVVQSSVRSDSADEKISRMSEILQKGRSACTGKVLVSAGLLRSAPLNADVRYMYGASSSFGDQRPHNIGHVWLRVAKDDMVVLYDPYYKHLVPYQLPNPTTFEGDPFAEYSVGAYCAANVVNQIPVKSLDNRFTKLVKETSGNKSAWIQNNQVLAAQIFGEIDFEFETKASGKLTFINGGLFSNRGGGAGFGYPLKDISKIRKGY
jgi:hypothetical protein